LYASIDGYKFNSTLPGKQTKMDEWMLSRLHSTIFKVTTFMDDYQFTQSSREIAKLIDDLSNWYIRRSRQRFWASGFSEDKRAAFNTLHEVLSTVCKLFAPFTPFIAEHIYMQLHDESVHLQDYPKPNKVVINDSLENEMKDV